MSLRFAKLTRPAIRALATGGKLAEHGITAERLTNGDVRYSVNVMCDGQRIHRVVGRESEGVTREQAERLIETLRTKAREGRLDLAAGRKLHRGFNEAADEYLERLDQAEGKNLAAKRMHLHQHLKPFFKNQRLDKIAEFSVLQYRKQRRLAGAAESTINREASTLRHLLRSAVRWKWIKADSLPPIPMSKERLQPIVALSDQQAVALMKAAIGDQDVYTWLFVACGLGSAMRHREILGIRYDQIDFENRRIFIPQAKAGAREQPITQALADALARQRAMEKDPDGWVFPSARPNVAKRPYRTNMTRQFARSAVRAGLDPDRVTPHTMRRTAITRLVKAGVDLPTIQRISGHKSIVMVLRYVNVHGEHIDAAIGKLEGEYSDMIAQQLHTPAVVSPSDRGAIVAISSAKSAA